MRSGKHNSIVTVAAAAAALALGAISTAGIRAGFIQRLRQSAGVGRRRRGASEGRAAIGSHPYSRHIDVAVKHGEVHLKGFVQDNRALLAANQVATQAAGDHKIVNELLIKENYPNAP